jgi:hypothetical protein
MAGGRADLQDHPWENVCHSVELVVDWGRGRMNVEGVSALSVDEIHQRQPMCSHLDPMKKIARTLLCSLKALFLNWFEAPWPGVARLKAITQSPTISEPTKSSKVNPIHGLGSLPEPEFVHKFR